MDDAKEALLWLRGPGLATEAEYQELCTSNIQQERKKGNLLKTLHKPNVWKPFLILFFFFAFQQLSGIYIILFYAVTVLTDVGVNIDQYVGSVGIGIVRLFTAIIGAGLARAFNRKTLACISGLGMTMFAAGVALSIRFNLPSWIPLLCIGSHVGFSMIGYLTLPWVMTSELYPLRFRGALSGLTTSLAQMLTFAAIKTYPDLSTTFGLEVVMWTFSSAAFVGAIFALTILPETRGRSLDQIEASFSRKSDAFNEESPSGMTVQPKNVTLKRFASISEEKCPDISICQESPWTNMYTYDNVCLDISLENSKGTDDTNAKTIMNEVKRNTRKSISLEHVSL